MEKYQPLIELLGGHTDPRVKSLLWAMQDPDMKGVSNEMLCALVRQEGFDPDDPPAFPLPRNMEENTFIIGDAICGDVVGQEVGMSESDLITHIGIFGSTNSGKSTVGKLIAYIFAKS